MVACWLYACNAVGLLTWAMLGAYSLLVYSNLCLWVLIGIHTGSVTRVQTKIYFDNNIIIKVVYGYKILLYIKVIIELSRWWDVFCSSSALAAIVYALLVAVLQ